MIGNLLSYMPQLIDGTGITIMLTVASMTIALVLGLLLALLRKAPIPPVRWIVATYVDLMRGTPLLLQLFYIYFVLPYVGIHLQPLTAAIIGLSANYAAYLSEVYRAAIDAIDKGQFEASNALGMSDPMLLRLIVLPQALRIALPPIGNYFISMFKDTALVSIIAVSDLMFSAQNLASTTYKYLPIFTSAFVLYFVISYPASIGVRLLERRLRRRARPQPTVATLKPQEAAR